MGWAPLHRMPLGGETVRIRILWLLWLSICYIIEVQQETYSDLANSFSNLFILVTVPADLFKVGHSVCLTSLKHEMFQVSDPVICSTNLFFPSSWSVSKFWIMCWRKMKQTNLFLIKSLFLSMMFLLRNTPSKLTLVVRNRYVSFFGNILWGFS